MKVFGSPTRVVLYSNYSPEECVRRLSAAIDPERYSLFGISGYRGSKPVLGTMDGLNFRILQRTYARNSFPPVFAGKFSARGRGTRIEGSSDLELTSKIAICAIVLFFFVLSPIIWFVAGPAHRWFVFVWIICSAVPGLFAPRIIRGLGTDQEREMNDFLCVTLAAGEDETAYTDGLQV